MARQRFVVINPNMSPEQMYYEGVAMGVAEMVRSVRKAQRKVGPRLYHHEVQRGYQDVLERVRDYVLSDTEE